MITSLDVRFELRDDSYTDEQIEPVIERTKRFLMGYCNNPKMFDEDELYLLDDVLLWCVCSRLNPNTRGLQGTTGENVGGASYTLLNDLPGYLKGVLNRFRRANFK